MLNNYPQIKSANWHITTRCNYNCKFCFSQELGPEITTIDEAHRILSLLKNLGIEKLNLVGGEPLLHPLFFEIVKAAKNKGFVTSLVSNGYYLNEAKLVEFSPFLDWIGLSVDSSLEVVETRLGRGRGQHISNIMYLSDKINQLGIKLKINTTVTRLNWLEHMQPLVKSLKPRRWKVFQVLHITGQNDQYFNELSITDQQFSCFKSLNQEPINGCTTVFENNHEMIGSYFMVSPDGQAMSNIDGSNRRFRPLTDINSENLGLVLDIPQYYGRNAIYRW
ncbi:MAG: viperin family antiviral radical SAM protein [Candidatus Bathyarchaeia archaeon]